MYHLHDDKRVAQSTAQICTALDELIAIMPYSDISVTALSKRAHISKATFYRSFDNIDDVLALQTGRVVDEMINYILESRMEIIAFRRGEGMFFQAFYRFWMTHSYIVEQLIKVKKEFILIEAFAAALQKNVDYFRHNMVIDDETLPYFISVRAATLTACLACWINDGKRTHPDKMPELMMKIMRPAEAIHGTNHN